jgi:hypothetical protein
LPVPAGPTVTTICWAASCRANTNASWFRVRGTKSMRRCCGRVADPKEMVFSTDCVIRFCAFAARFLLKSVTPCGVHYVGTKIFKAVDNDKSIG